MVKIAQHLKGTRMIIELKQEERKIVKKSVKKQTDDGASIVEFKSKNQAANEKVVQSILARAEKINW